MLLFEVVVYNIDIPATTRRIEAFGRSFLTRLNASNASSIFFLASNRLSETKVALSLSNVINISFQDFLFITFSLDRLTIGSPARSYRSWPQQDPDRRIVPP